jgi:hypothetical protein
LSEVRDVGEDEPAGWREGCVASRINGLVETGVGPPERQKGVVTWIFHSIRFRDGTPTDIRTGFGIGRYPANTSYSEEGNIDQCAEL